MAEKKKAKGREMLRMEKELMAKRQELLKRIEQQRAAMIAKHDPDDEGAAAVSSVETELAATTLDRAMRSLREIEAALKSIESGDYGICARCAEPISEARMQALPWTRVCVECAGGGVKQDKQEGRVHAYIAASALSSSGGHSRTRAK
jgi:RNA polymerase-binding protein DksA